MFICSCAAVTDSELKEAIRKGHNTLEALMFETGASLGCSMCREDVERILIETNQCGYSAGFMNLSIEVIKPF